VNALAVVLNENLRKLGCLEWWWLEGIYSPQPPTPVCGGVGGWGPPHRGGGASHVTQPLGFGAVDRWRVCHLVAPDRHCSVCGAPLTSAL
jgi:hypothetical protein